MIDLHNAADLVAIRYRYVKTPIAITARNRAGDASTGQFIKDARRQHKRRPPTGLLVGNRLQKIEPNNVAFIGTIGGHVTSPCLIASARTPIGFLRNVVACHPVQQFIKRVARFTCRLDNGAQHQGAVFDFYFRPFAIACFYGIR